jgi:hypothetical protein
LTGRDSMSFKTPFEIQGGIQNSGETTSAFSAPIQSAAAVNTTLFPEATGGSRERIMHESEVELNGDLELRWVGDNPATDRRRCVRVFRQPTCCLGKDPQNPAAAPRTRGEARTRLRKPKFRVPACRGGCVQLG